MDLRRCIRSDRFALFVGLCALITIFYIASNYFDLKENFSIIPIQLIPLSVLRSTNKTKHTINATKQPKSTRPTLLMDSKNIEIDKELLLVKSDKNYPPFVKLDILKTLSLKELKERSYGLDFQNPSVVPIIHQSWKVKTLPPRFVNWSKTWQEKFPDFQYKLWTDVDNHNFVKNYFPWFWKRYDRLTHPVQKADAVRYMYLFAQGGIYADLDDECLKNFEHLLKNYSVVFGAMQGKWYPPNHVAYIEEGYVQNSFMYSVPGHPFWLEVLDTILKRPPSGSAESTTGPFMLQEVIGGWRKKHPRRQRHEMKIYKPEYFNPFSWINHKYPECKDVNRMTSKDIIACKSHFKNSYVIQYHTQTWGRGARNTNRKDRRRI